MVQELQPPTTCSQEALAAPATKRALSASKQLRPTSLENPLDLHIYSVKGALLRTYLFLCAQEAIRPTGLPLKLTIITGWGKHSKGPARIRPAVIEFLREKNYVWEEDLSNPGRLHVWLQD